MYRILQEYLSLDFSVSDDFLSMFNNKLRNILDKNEDLQ